MFNTLVRWLSRILLSLRYRVRVVGLEEIARRGTRGILFLPNHPALIDPVIVLTYLHARFRPRPLADQDQINLPFLRLIAKRLGVLPIPDLLKHGPGVLDEMKAAVQRCVGVLEGGQNLVLYPAGHLYRSRFEDLRGNSGAELVVRAAPQARVVLVRSRGIWGSSFSMAGGTAPSTAACLKHGAWALLKSLVFFCPRREVTLELMEPADLPRNAGREPFNRYLESYYNAEALPARYVPYTPWEKGGRCELPEPTWTGLQGDPSRVPPATRQLVVEFIKQLAEVEAVQNEQTLAHDLGLDSLDRAELLLWLQKEFGFAGADVDSIRTVGDVLLAARGEAVASRVASLKPVPAKWARGFQHARLAPPSEKTVTDAFLARARAQPGRIVIADQISGGKTYRDIVTALHVLVPLIEPLPGKCIGIMLPATVTADIVYLATLFAGKTPVMVNWTTGARNTLHALEIVGARTVLTSRALVTRIESQGLDLGGVKDRLAYLEDFAAKLTLGVKLRAALRGRLNWTRLRRRRLDPQQPAVILLTSGSETLPKAVPLTHANLLQNIGDVLRAIRIHDDDCMLAFLPPFHSFGLTVTTVVPLVTGMRAVYHANPTEAWMLAKLLEAYRATLLLGTPTFLSGIIRSASGIRLDSLRMAVTGAEKCPERVYEMLRQACPQALILEGYGITECSPIVSANREESFRHGSIGQVMPSYEWVLVDSDTGQRVAPGQPGILLVRGPCVFGGYLGADAPNPFVEFEGRQWYRTGDLVAVGADGNLDFRGRLKRFVKLGGEMISLPAIEAVLEQAYASEQDEGPVLAVEATPNEEHPELVLFTVREIERAAANQCLRAAGLSPLHNISTVKRVPQIPVLGTGKTDYRALQAQLNPTP